MPASDLSAPEPALVLMRGKGSRRGRCEVFSAMIGAVMAVACEPSAGLEPRGTGASGSRHTAPTPSPPAHRGPVPVQSASPGREPLRTSNWLVELELEGFGSALVAPPQGITRPRPVLVALHGYADRPDWQCGAWTGISRAAVFVLCPRGVALPEPPGNYSFGSLTHTEREVKAALAALKRRFAGYVGSSVVLVGYSLGAQRAALLASRDPKLFRRVALVEGGTRQWSRGASRRFQEGGGQRLLLVCSQAGCESALRALEERSRGPTTRVRIEYLGPLGHQMGPSVTRRLKEPWAWLSEGLL